MVTVNLFSFDFFPYVRNFNKIKREHIKIDLYPCFFYCISYYDFVVYILRLCPHEDNMGTNLLILIDKDVIIKINNIFLSCNKMKWLLYTAG